MAKQRVIKLFIFKNKNFSKTSKGDNNSMKFCSLVYEEDEVHHKSFFSEIISSISDVKFSRDGRFIMARDYMTIKIWDINMEKKPVRTIHMHDHLQNKLCDLYENDCIFDKFECCMSNDARYHLDFFLVI